VLIDTAGRYTTQDSDAKSDKQSWFSFLDLLKKNRPRQPINGVLVAISIEDLTHCRRQRSPPTPMRSARLLDLHQRLKVDFPVYALFTKADLIAGFTEYFSYLNEAGRRQVWGATFQTANKKQNLVGEVPKQFDAAGVAERGDDRSPAGRAIAQLSRVAVRLSAADGRLKRDPLQLSQRRYSNRPAITSTRRCAASISPRAPSRARRSIN
jgi:type VI protein secretion system component VasK